MNFDIKDLKSWSNRHDVKIKSVTGFFGNSLLEIDNEIRRYNKGEKGHLHELYQISDNGCFCFGYATYFADTGAFGGTNNFAFFLPLDAVKKEIKINFDIKDVKSWSNRYDVKIGDEGYFFYDIDKLRNFENEYIKPVKSKLSAIRDNCTTCFQIDNGHDGYNVFPFFLPLDAVKKDKISDDTSVPNYHLTENKMKHTEKTRINQFLSDLSLTEATIILQSLLALNHKLLDELADYANTASYDHFEVTKDSLIAVSSLIDRLTSVYDVKLMEKEEE